MIEPNSYLRRLLEAVLASKLLAFLSLVGFLIPSTLALIAWASSAPGWLPPVLALLTAAVGVVLLYYFSSHLISADLEKIRQLEGRLAEVESSRCRLAVRYEKGVSPYSESGWFRIGIRNNGGAVAENVEVELLSIDSETSNDDPVSNPTLEQGANQADLRIAVVRPPWQVARYGGDSSNCRINPGTQTFFDVMHELTGSGDLRRKWGVETVKWNARPLKLGMDDYYVLRLRVSEAGTEPQDFSVRIRQTSGGDVLFLPDEGFAT